MKTEKRKGDAWQQERKERRKSPPSLPPSLPSCLQLAKRTCIAPPRLLPGRSPMADALVVQVDDGVD
eukprot:2614262-Rhodomonas_salina.2